MSLPRNTLNERALNLEDLSPDTTFVVKKSGNVVMRGTFVGVSEYTEEGGWSDIPAVTPDGTETSVSPYAIGIVCQPNGTWEPDTFVLGAETLE